MSVTKPTQQMALVEIRHVGFLLPALKALELVKLLQGSAKVAEWDYSSRFDHDALRMNLIASPIGEIRMTTVDSRQIQETQPAAPRSRKRSDSVQVPESSGN